MIDGRRLNAAMDNAASVMGLVFGLFSIVACAIMITLLTKDVATRTQTRPRMLIVLAVLDGLSALGFFIAKLYHFWQWQSVVFGYILGTLFLYASWTWTCCIAFHVYYVMRKDLEPNGAEEQRQLNEQVKRRPVDTRVHQHLSAKTKDSILT